MAKFILDPCVEGEWRFIEGFIDARRFYKEKTLPDYGGDPFSGQ